MSNELMTVAVYVGGECVFESVAKLAKSGKCLYAGGKAVVDASKVVKVVVSKGDVNPTLAGVGNGKFVAKGGEKQVNAYVTAGPARCNVTLIGTAGATSIPAGEQMAQIGVNISL